MPKDDIVRLKNNFQGEVDGATLYDALAEAGRPDIMVVVGGVIPPDDFGALYAAGALAIFGPGTSIAEAAADLLAKLNAHLGYAKREAAE